jgi:hypothetical protein
MKEGGLGILLRLREVREREGGKEVGSLSRGIEG